MRKTSSSNALTRVQSSDEVDIVPTSGECKMLPVQDVSSYEALPADFVRPRSILASRSNVSVAAMPSLPPVPRQHSNGQVDSEAHAQAHARVQAHIQSHDNLAWPQGPTAQAAHPLARGNSNSTANGEPAFHNASSADPALSRPQTGNSRPVSNLSTRPVSNLSTGSSFVRPADAYARASLKPGAMAAYGNARISPPQPNAMPLRDALRSDDHADGAVPASPQRQVQHQMPRVDAMNALLRMPHTPPGLNAVSPYHNEIELGAVAPPPPPQQHRGTSSPENGMMAPQGMPRQPRGGDRWPDARGGSPPGHGGAAARQQPPPAHTFYDRDEGEAFEHVRKASRGSRRTRSGSRRSDADLQQMW